MVQEDACVAGACLSCGLKEVIIKPSVYVVSLLSFAPCQVLFCDVL
jgi:hypothetical protein